ncbi:STS14 protein-like [Abrus precatorius]|uniref:STS14 protein-like n=1 Tax=Abrus precatorius TaxID=3816 RepID=A0A8B8M6A1_ABRPR|nr:STS14 protein-like [Abrus precatorius]
MGACASSHSATMTKTTSASAKGGIACATESFRRPSSIVVMDMMGGTKEYRQPIPASMVLSENPNCYLCNSESMYIGTCMPRMADEEELQPGRIYFLVPLSHFHSPLSLRLLCDLAVKASTALVKTNDNGVSVQRPLFTTARTNTRSEEDKVKMKTFHHPLFSLAALAIFLVSATAPEPAPPPPTLTAAAREFLEAHNEARGAVGVEPLKWSEKLANLTSLLVRYQRNKKGCEFANLTASKYGGNQLWAGMMAVTPSAAVEEWVKEKDFYIHANNTCVSKHECGVYTQVVWRNSTELGCSQATCVKEQASLTICFYDPPGNVIGETPY